jgi:hypothetical protein
MSQGFPPPQDDYNAPRPPVGGRSGAVTAVGIIGILFGAFNTIIGVAVMVAGPAIMAWLFGAASSAIDTSKLTPEQRQALGQASQAVQAGGGIMAMLAGFVGVCFLIFGLPTLFGGIGVVNRRQWGRILTIVMAIFFGLWGVLNILGANIVGFVIDVGFCVFALVVLFNSKFAAEFR